MHVGVALIELRIHDSQSLKAKRGVVRSVAARLRNRFNISVAEVGGQGTWQRATLGLTTAGNDERLLRKVLGQAIEFVEEMRLAEVADSDVAILAAPLEGAAAEAMLPDDPDAAWATNLAGAGESSRHG